MRNNDSLTIFRLYEFLRKRGGNVSDYELVKAFKCATSDEIFQAKCLLDDYKKKHPLLADRECSTKSKTRNKFTINNRNYGKRRDKKVNDS